MTLAPETPRLTELLDVLAAADVTSSFGHTDASSVETRAAVRAVGGDDGSGPRTCSTACRRCTPRAPGPGRGMLWRPRPGGDGCGAGR